MVKGKFFTIIQMYNYNSLIIGQLYPFHVSKIVHILIRIVLIK